MATTIEMVKDRHTSTHNCGHPVLFQTNQFLLALDRPPLIWCQSGLLHMMGSCLSSKQLAMAKLYFWFDMLYLMAFNVH